MHRTRTILLAGALALSTSLGGCAAITTAYDSLTSQTPAQVTTLADAEQAATLATNAVDVYVKSGATISPATLQELVTLNDAVHAALTDLQNAQASGRSLSYAAFNAAFDAFTAYATQQGIKTG